jgi:hypothetical protein
MLILDCLPFPAEMEWETEETRLLTAQGLGERMEE